MNFSRLLSHSARVYKNKTALTLRSQQITFRQLEQQCIRYGRALYSLGLKKGDRVGVLDYNSIEAAILYCSIPSCGMVTLTLNYRLAEEELINILEDAQVSALVYAPEFSETVKNMRPRLGFIDHYICSKGESHDAVLESLVKKAPQIAWDEPKSSDLAMLVYTSGTTGKPKGAMLSHKNITSTIISVLMEMILTPEDIGLLAAPIFHVAGCTNLMSLVTRGCTCHLLPGFDAGETLKALARTKATFTVLMPIMINEVLNVPGQEKVDLSSLRLIVYAASPIPEKLLKRAIERFGYVFHQGYGLTETGVITCLPREDHRKKALLVSAGREMFGCEVEVIDDAGDEAPVGQIGQVIVRGEGVTSGYWNNPAETAACLKNGWFYTGDAALRDENGYIFLKDRKKDMIVTGGENVYPIEVENILYEMPSIKEAAVIGVPDEKWGEKVIALVHLVPGANASKKEIISFCRKKLAGYKCPKHVEFVGTLPRNHAGKIQKHILREPYWKGHKRSIG